MNATMSALIKSVQTNHDYRGEERQVVEIELPDGNTVKAFDDTQEITEEMAGQEHDITLMARAAKHEGNWGSEFIENPYYCLVSGEIIGKNLKQGEHQAASIDFGEGEMIVSYHPDISHIFRKGKRLDVLADKLVLLELA